MRHPYYETPREKQFQSFIEDIEQFIRKCEEQRRQLEGRKIIELGHQPEGQH